MSDFQRVTTGLQAAFLFETWVFMKKNYGFSASVVIWGRWMCLKLKPILGYTAKQMLAWTASWNSCVSYSDSESTGYNTIETADARNWGPSSYKSCFIMYKSYKPKNATVVSPSSTQQLPSGNLTYNSYRKLPFIVDFPLKLQRVNPILFPWYPF